MNDNIKGWLKVFAKILIALILVAVVWASFLPIKEKVDMYNSYVQVGQFLCPPSSLGVDFGYNKSKYP